MKINLKSLKESTHFLNELYENVTAAIFLADREARIYSFNDSFKTLFYKPEDRLLHQLCGEAMGCIFHIEEIKPCGEASVCCDCILRRNIIKSMLEKVPIYKSHLDRKFSIQGVFIEKHFIFTTKYINYNNLEMVLVIMDDITDLENQKQIITSQKKNLLEINHDLHIRNRNLEGLLLRSLDDLHLIKENLQQQKKTNKELLLEVQHRVGNSLAVISALLELQKDELDETNYQEKINETETRIRVIKKLHDHLFSSHYESFIKLETFLPSLLAELESIYHTAKAEIQLTAPAGSLRLPLAKALSAGLILNELYLNLEKTENPGTLEIRVSACPGRLPDSCQLKFECTNISFAGEQQQLTEFISLFIHPRDGALSYVYSPERFFCQVEL